MDREVAEARARIMEERNDMTNRVEQQKKRQEEELEEMRKRVRQDATTVARTRL